MRDLRLSVRLEDAKGELIELQQSLKDTGETVRVREVGKALDALEEAHDFIRQFEAMRSDLDNLLAWVRT